MEFLNNLATVVGRLANYKYFNMDQSIINALELFDSGATRVAIRQFMQAVTGGPEALIQLALAFNTWMPTRTFITHQSKRSEENIEQWFGLGYPEIAGVQTIHENKLKKGDILIIPEICSCPKNLIDKGVKVYIWLLSVKDTAGGLAAGCKYISHTHFLAKADGFSVPRSQVALPYLGRNKVHFGPVNNEKREDLILANPDHNKHTDAEQLAKYCEQREKPCKVVKLKGFTRDQLVDLYKKAKVIVTSCLNGAERSVLEAVTYGAIMVTNYCDNGADNRDFPIPRDHLYKDAINKEEIGQVVERLLSDFENQQAKQENLRSLYRSYGPKSLIEDTKRFIHEQN
jgi:hypothetical protein